MKGYDMYNKIVKCYTTKTKGNQDKLLKILSKNLLRSYQLYTILIINTVWVSAIKSAVAHLSHKLPVAKC